MIEQLEDFPDDTVAFACHGHVTRDDYLTSLLPAVESAFSKHEKLRLYYEIGDDFRYVDPAAVWTDFKTGLEHWLRWERIAVVTDVDWIRNMMWAFGFLIPGSIRLYSLEEKDDAKAWITEK